MELVHSTDASAPAESFVDTPRDLPDLKVVGRNDEDVIERERSGFAPLIGPGPIDQTEGVFIRGDGQGDRRPRIGLPVRGSARPYLAGSPSDFQAPRARLFQPSILGRSGDRTLSGWRLEVASDQGAGAIVLVGTEARYYRGEQILLGWAQERLASLYEAFLPRPDQNPFETLQLG